MSDIEANESKETTSTSTDATGASHAKKKEKVISHLGVPDLAISESKAAEIAALSTSASEIAELRLSQDYSAALTVEEVLTTIPIQKPNKEWLIRVHPKWGIEMATLELKTDRELYVLSNNLHKQLPPELLGLVSRAVLLPTMNRLGHFLFWPLKVPDVDGKPNDWHRSAIEAANIARTHWVRVVADMSRQRYVTFKATGEILEPEWPSSSFEDLLMTAVKGKVVNSLDHPVLKKLRGEV